MRCAIAATWISSPRINVDERFFEEDFPFELDDLLPQNRVTLVRAVLRFRMFLAGES